MTAEEELGNYAFRDVVRAIQLTAIDSMEIEDSTVYGTGSEEGSGMELSRLAEECGVNEDGLRRRVESDSRVDEVPDGDGAMRCVLDSLRECDDAEVPKAPERGRVSQRTGIPEDRLEEVLDEGWEFVVRAAGMRPPGHELRRETAKAVVNLSNNRGAPTREEVSENTGMRASQITEVAEDGYADLCRSQGKIPSRNRVVGDYMEAYDMLQFSDSPVATDTACNATPATSLDRAQSHLSHRQAREKLGLNRVLEASDDGRPSGLSEYVDAVAREMELDPAFDAYETSSKRNQGSVSFGIGGEDYDLVFMEVMDRRMTSLTAMEEGKLYDGEPPDGSATPQEVVKYLQDALS